MQNESQLAKKFMNKLKEKIPSAVIFRHCERYTRGVPDYSVTLGKKTAWIEFKMHGAGQFSPMQIKHIMAMGNLFVVLLGNPTCGPFATYEDRRISAILSFLRPTRK